jgi:CBS domain-containing protein
METASPSTGTPGPSFAHATVADAMHAGVLTCDPATPLTTIAQRMAAEHIHSIVMLVGGTDPHERIPWSVVTDADVLRHAARAAELTAGDVATDECLQVHADDPLSVAATRMARRAVTHAVVVDRDRGRPVGVLSALDVARVLAWGRA